MHDALCVVRNLVTILIFIFSIKFTSIFNFKKFKLFTFSTIVVKGGNKQVMKVKRMHLHILGRFVLGKSSGSFYYLNIKIFLKRIVLQS